MSHDDFPDRFELWDADEAHEALRVPGWLDEARSLSAGALSSDVPAKNYGTDNSQTMYEDTDHWLDGEGFLAPLPHDSDQAKQDYLDGLEQTFVVEDVTSDVVERRTQGVLGTPPTYSLMRQDALESERSEGNPSGDALASGSPSEDAEEQVSDAERRAALESWWEDADALDTLRRFATALSVEARSYLRIIIPPGKLDATQGPTGAENASGDVQGAEAREAADVAAPVLPDVDSPAEALDMIRVEQVGRDQAVEYEDPNSKDRLGVVAFEGQDEEADDDVRFAELTWVREEDGETVLKTVHEAKDGIVWRAPLRGNKLVYEGTSRLVVNEGVRKNQKSLNTTRTMIAIVDHEVGFPEVTFIDVEKPEDEKGNEVQPKRGPGSMGFFVSVPERAQNESGGVEERDVNPTINHRDPASTENLRKDCDVARQAIFRSAKQLHVFLTGDAGASGESRIQARADYQGDLEKLKGTVDEAGRWMLETVWALAEVLSGQEPSQDLSATFETVVDAGPLSAQERKTILRAVDEQLISKRRARRLWGVQDPEQEAEQIAEEQETEKTERERLEEQRLRSNIQANDELQRRRQTIEQEASANAQSQPNGEPDSE